MANEIVADVGWLPELPLLAEVRKRPTDDQRDLPTVPKPKRPKASAEAEDPPSFPDDCFVNSQPRELHCVKCNQVPSNPKRSKCCNTLYCEPCTKAVGQCPVHKRDQEYSVDQVLKTRLRKLTVRCIYKCGYKCPMYHMRDHLSNCPNYTITEKFSGTTSESQSSVKTPTKGKTMTSNITTPTSNPASTSEHTGPVVASNPLTPLQAMILQNVANSPKKSKHQDLPLPETFDQEDFTHKQPPDRFCIKCNRVPFNPQRSNCCNRLYCKPCSIKTTKCSKKHHNDPMSYALDKSLYSNIQKLQIKCKNWREGCDWKDVVYKLKSHLPECDKEPRSKKIRNNSQQFSFDTANGTPTSSTEAHTKNGIVLNVAGTVPTSLSVACEYEDEEISNHTAGVGGTTPNHEHPGSETRLLHKTGSSGDAVKTRKSLLKFPVPEENGSATNAQAETPTLAVEEDRELTNHVQDSDRVDSDYVEPSIPSLMSALSNSLTQPISKLRSQMESLVKENKQLRAEIDSVKAEMVSLVDKLRAEAARCKELETLKIPPLTFPITSFSNYEAPNSPWMSSSFYTHSSGYRVSLLVSRRKDDGILGIGLSSEKGVNDSNLRWPVEGRMNIVLLNQEADQDHHSTSVKFTLHKHSEESEQVRLRGVRIPTINGRSYTALDCLYLRLVSVSFDHENSKPWLLSVTP